MERILVTVQNANLNQSVLKILEKENDGRPFIEWKPPYEKEGKWVHEVIFLKGDKIQPNPQSPEGHLFYQELVRHSETVIRVI
ncbi:MAG TPA: hypothetical protein VNV15_03520 [Opitutaceae bacterium]|jgi:hypothetical protein|nr:hypothetical protein [Opitutaceae bacterium]